MSMKALQKQLVAAIAMVLVAAVALGSSTYAWFASNDKVSATNMQVQAQVEGGIEIAHALSSGSGASYATTSETDLAKATLYPTSTKDTSAWYHASAARSTASDATINTRETLTIVEANGLGQTKDDKSNVTGTYYLVDNFNIRSVSTKLAKGLTVDSVAVTGAAADATTSKAVRVAVVLGAKVLVYAPLNNNVGTYTVYSGYTGTGTDGDPYAATSAGTVTPTDKDTATLLAATAATEIPTKGSGNVNGGVDVKIFVYFEGEDTNLYTSNFKAEDLTVTVNFSATI